MRKKVLCATLSLYRYKLTNFIAILTLRLFHHHVSSLTCKKENTKRRKTETILVSFVFGSGEVGTLAADCIEGTLVGKEIKMVFLLWW